MFGFSTVTFAETDKQSTATIEFQADPDANKLELITALSIDFGIKDLPTGAATYTATTVSGILSVQDTRGLAEAGWETTAKMGYFNSGSVTNTAVGATLTLSNGTLSTDGVDANRPVLENSIALTAGSDSAVPVMSAEPTYGVGIWDVQWAPANVTLNLLETPVRGVNTAVIDWVIVSDPDTP